MDHGQREGKGGPRRRPKNELTRTSTTSTSALRGTVQTDGRRLPGQVLAIHAEQTWPVHNPSALQEHHRSPPEASPGRPSPGPAYADPPAGAIRETGQGRPERRPRGRPFRNKAILHTHRLISAALAKAVRWQRLARNPADAVDPPKVRPHEMRVLDPAGTARLVTAAAGTTLHLPILLAVCCGCAAARSWGSAGQTWTKGQGTYTCAGRSRRPRPAASVSRSPKAAAPGGRAARDGDHRSAMPREIERET